MSMRSTTETVTFRHDFSLAGYDDLLPAGAYEVLREDELLEGLTFDAYRRVATFLRVRGQGALAGQVELRPIAEADLEAARHRDELATQTASADGSMPRKDRT